MDALTKLAVFNDLAPAENLVRRLEGSGLEVSVLVLNPLRLLSQLAWWSLVW